MVARFPFLNGTARDSGISTAIPVSFIIIYM